MLEAEKKKNVNGIDERVKELLEFNVLEKIDSSLNNANILELVFKLYEIIDLIKEKKIDKLEGIKNFLLYFDEVLKYIKNININSPLISELDKFLIEKQSLLSKYINNEESDGKILEELQKILLQTEDLYRKISEPISKHEEHKLEIDGLDKIKNKFDIPEIDELYKKLYDAISNNDVKKITLYRGRIIRALKHNKKKINNKYEKVKCLDEINVLLNSNDPRMMKQIETILSKEENITYKYYLEDSMHNSLKFRENFEKLYVEMQVKKIVLYKNALKEELKEHGRVLDERYAKEFLDKKGTLLSLINVLPNAVVLSVKKLANTINELKESKTNRKKVSKIFDVVKTSGKVVGTPVLYLGKFVTSNWYSFYSLYKGYMTQKSINPKNENVQSEDVGAQDNEVVVQEPVDDTVVQAPETMVELEQSDENITPELELPIRERPLIIPNNSDGPVMVYDGQLEYSDTIGDAEEYTGTSSFTPTLPTIRGNDPIFRATFDNENAMLYDPSMEVEPFVDTTVQPNPSHAPSPEEDANEGVLSNVLTTTSSALDVLNMNNYIWLPYVFNTSDNALEPASGYGASTWNNMVTDHNLKVLDNYRVLLEAMGNQMVEDAENTIEDIEDKVEQVEDEISDFATDMVESVENVMDMMMKSLGK